MTFPTGVGAQQHLIDCGDEIDEDDLPAGGRTRHISAMAAWSGGGCDEVDGEGGACAGAAEHGRAEVDAGQSDAGRVVGEVEAGLENPNG